MSNKLCIIAARGGSKRIPKKNIKLFLGKPIIEYSIETALKSKLFDEVMVSTDSNEIAEIAISCGAKVPFIRSSKNSNDYSTTFDVINEVVSNYKLINREFEYTCCIYSCAPFITTQKLKEAFKMLVKGKFDSVFPVMPYSFPVQRSLLKNNTNKISFFYPEYSLSRSQDLEKSYHDAGQFYWLKTNICINKKVTITQNSGCIVISEIEGQDIDNEVDWIIAELKFKLKKTLNN